MKEWSSDWVAIEETMHNPAIFQQFGIYQIRIVTPTNAPIPIPRIGGIDPIGILYIGRSGYAKKSNRRTIAKRLSEFIQQRHSGGITYARAKSVLQHMQQFSGHRLQCRAISLDDQDIDTVESQFLLEYFRTYAELPPCNSSLPKAALNK